MITKKQVIREFVTAVRKALNKKLDAESYSEYLRGSVSVRLDLLLKPERFFINLDLPSRKEPTEPKTLKVEFKRRYTRRQYLEIPPKDTETPGGLNAIET